MPSEIVVTWPGGERAFSTAPAGSVLDAALAANIPVPHSCKRADCLSCSAIVVRSDAQALVPGSLVQLCQVAADREGVFELAEDPHIEIIQPKLFPAKVHDIVEVANDVFRARFNTRPGQNIAFKGGQYATIGLKSGGSRSYSIADVDAAQGRIEFYIKNVRGGMFSDWLSRTAKPGDLVHMRAPYGSFFFRGEEPSAIWLFATGTGIVPIYAMLKANSFPQSRANSQIHLVWGNRQAGDVFLQGELSRLCEDRNVAVQYVFSREPTQAARRVTDIAARSAYHGAAVYAAGHPDMVRDIRGICLANHLDPRRFYSDAFTFSGLNEIAGQAS